MKNYKRSPWGKVQDQEKICDFMIFVSTPSHGGVKVDKKYNQLIPDCLRNKDGWYEEDCEYCIPYYFFHEYFNAPFSKDTYLQTLKNYFPYKIEQAMGIIVEEGKSCVKDRDAFLERNKNNWVSFSNLQIENNVKSWIRKNSTGEEKCIIVSADIHESKKTNFGCVYMDQEILNLIQIQGF